MFLSVYVTIIDTNENEQKQGRGKSKQKQSPKVDQGKGKLFLAIERQKCIAIINSTMGRL